MTTVAVLADPPVAGDVFTDLVTEDLLDDEEAADLYAAALADVCAAVRASGGDLLVNYRGAEDVAVEDPETAVRDALGTRLDDVEGVRFEVQVGSTFAARVGNTVTHLLEEEGVETAAAVTPSAALLGRTHVDSAAMKLRNSGVVLGPTTDGDVYYAGFREPVAFGDAYETPAVETLTARAADAGLDVDFLESLPTVGRQRALRTALPLLTAKQRAGAAVPARTSDVLGDLDLTVVERDGRARLVRE